MQKTVETFIHQHNLSCGVEMRYIDLTSEVGELGKEILKGSCYGQESCQITVQAETEVGDCLFTLLALCSEMGIDAEEALRAALRKYEERIRQKGEISSGK